VIQVTRQQDSTVETAYPQYASDADWCENTERVLGNSVQTMLHGGPHRRFVSAFKKSGVIKTNRRELQQYALQPYFKTRDFRKKIAMLYVPVLEPHLKSSNGRFPVFKVSATAFDALLKKASSVSSAQRPKKSKQAINSNYNNHSYGHAVARGNQNSVSQSRKSGGMANLKGSAAHGKEHRKSDLKASKAKMKAQ